MTSVTVTGSTFVIPSAKSELNGELGLTLHEVATSLGIEFKHAKAVLEKNINDYSTVEISATVNAGFAGTVEVKSYVLDVDDAKLFVASYNNDVGKGYRKFLIQCEKKLTQIVENPFETLYGKLNQNELSALSKAFSSAAELVGSAVKERDQAIATKFQISDKKTATAMATASHLKRENNKITIALTEAKEEVSLLKNAHDSYLTVVRAKEAYPALKPLDSGKIGQSLSKYCNNMNEGFKKIPVSGSVYGHVNAYPKAAIENWMIINGLPTVNSKK